MEQNAKPKVGQHVVYHDTAGQPHDALVTAAWSQTCVNLVFVNEEKGNDQYGAQLDRYATSCCLWSPQSAHGNYWRYADQTKPLQGIPVRIEYERGHLRTGTDRNGKEWSREMKAGYGRVTGSKGSAPSIEGDGEAVDVYVGPDSNAPNVYCLRQHVDGDPSKKFDEWKCILGCRSEEEAVKLYLAHYPKGWKVGEVKEMSVADFRGWVLDSKCNNCGKTEKTGCCAA